MDTILLGNLPDPYPLTYGVGFSIEPSDLYDPDTGMAPLERSATKYSTSFLIPIDHLEQVRDLIKGAIVTFMDTGEPEYVSVTVTSTDNLAVLPGTYEVFWIDHKYDRYDNQVEVTLMGYGVLEAASIVPDQTFSVVEGVANGTVVGVVKGFKPTLTLESRPDVPFSYQPSSGTLSVSGVLDYETNPEWVLNIGGTEVTVWVLDAPENPAPAQTEYTWYLDPETKPGTVVGTVAATQQGDSGPVPQYNLVSGNTGGWAIDTNSGDITYVGGQPLQDNQVLGVGYGGASPLSVTLRVLPSGVVTLPILRFSLPPTLSDGQLVGSVGAEGVVARLVHSGFSVTDNKLYVQDKTQIEPGLVELSLELSAEGARTGTQQVYVTVAEHPTINEFWVGEDLSNGSTVGTVELPGGAAYSVAPNTIFSINSGTGELILTNSSLMNVGSYPLTISRGSASTTATVKVYAVLTTEGLELTVAPSTPSGTTIGTVAGTSPFSSSGTITPYTLDSTTGEIKLASTPPIALNFTVTDGAGDTTDVAISLEQATGGTAGFIGAVYPGQQGQAVASKSGVLFSVGAIGFGQGSLNVDPDNLGPVSRNTEGKLVASKAPGTQLSVSAAVNSAMLGKLKEYWSQPLETPITVSVTGEDWIALLVNFKRGYGGDNPTVNLDLRTN